MTDDPTRSIETPKPADQPAAAAGSAAEPAAPAAAPGPEVAAPAQPATAVDQPAPAGAQPVASAPGPNRLRWAIGFGVAGLAIAVAIAAVLVLASRPVPEALKYIPADAAAVAEIRMDLPGDQVQKLGNLLAHFPGFLDQATLPDKLDESFSRLVGRAASGLDYRTDIKPWLSGPAFVGVWAPTDQSAQPDRVLVSATTTGTVDCNKPFGSQPPTHESYHGLDLFVGVTGSDRRTSVCVLDGRQALLGDETSVKAAIDAHGASSGMDHSQGYAAARAALQGDQLATVYIDGTNYKKVLGNQSPGSAATPGASGLTDLSAVTGPLPAWVITGFRAEDDALVMDSISGPPLDAQAGASAGPSLLALPPTHASVIAPLAPADTILYAEAQGVGVGLQNLVSRLRTMPDLATAFQMLDGAGGAGQLVGWVEDAGIIVTKGGQTPTGGLALVAADDATATQRVSQLSGLLAFAGFGNNSIQTRQSTIAGVTVTTISITNIESLVPPGQLPPGVSVPPDAKVEFSIAAKGRVILIGTGEAFMTAVLNTPAGGGLLDQAGYKQATARALANSRMTVYVGVGDIVGLADAFIPAADRAAWESDVKPYVAPLQAISLTSAGEGAGSHQRITITVTKR
jgi:hypothetical protein